MKVEKTAKGTREQQRDYLLKKMYQGAEALYDFFETLRERRDVNVRDVAARVKTEYGLTDNQQRYLDKVVVRAVKARTIVQYLEKRFGLNENGTFKDSKGLSSLLFGAKAPETAEVRSYGFGIGVTNNHWDDDETYGLRHPCENPREDPLKVDANSTISRLARGNSSGCQGLVFCIPLDSGLQKIIDGEEGKLTDSFKAVRNRIEGVPTVEKVKKETVDHELRHVIDAIMGTEYNFFGETACYLFDGSGPVHGLELDFDSEIGRKENLAQSSRDRLEYLTRNDSPKMLRDMARGAIEKYTRKVEELKKYKREHFVLFTSLSSPKFSTSEGYSRSKDEGVTSYLFSTIPKEKLFRRLMSFAIRWRNQELQEFYMDMGGKK